MTSREAKALGIPLSALNPKIPRGWFKVKRGDVQEGDRIWEHESENWMTAFYGTLGTNSKFYPCVIRKIQPKKTK